MRSKSTDSALRPFLQQATCPTVDRFGKITIDSGDWMLVDPNSHTCELATGAAREAFLLNGFSFVVNPCDEMSQCINACESAAQTFGTAIEANAKAMVGAIIPNVNLPFWSRMIPFGLAFGSCMELKPCQTHFINHLVEHGVLPEREQVGADVWQHLERMNQCRVYELRGKGVAFHIYAVFVTPVRIANCDGVRKLAFAKADANVSAAIAAFVNAWKRRFASPQCLCLSLGTFAGWVDEANTVASSDWIQVFSSPSEREDGVWKVRHTAIDPMRPVYRALIYSLYPETVNERYLRIKQELESFFNGSMTVERMSRQTGIPADCVASVFDELVAQDSKRWCAYETIRKELAIGLRSEIQTPLKRKFVARSPSGVLCALDGGMFVFSIVALLGAFVWMLISWRLAGVVSFRQVASIVISALACAVTTFVSNDIKTKIKRN